MCSDLEWRMTKLHIEREKWDLLHRTNQQRENTLKKCFEILHEDKAALHENKKSYFEVREELIKTGAQLVMRRKQLISELSLIYPIIEDREGDHRICGVRLPDSEDFAGQDEIMISVALGYTSHLVAMIAQFLDVPLRYPVTCLGSRSQISDFIIDKLTDKEREFPLHSKGNERLQFNYAVYLLIKTLPRFQFNCAVYLLNKDIAQLRFYCGLGTTDLRLTLPNLKTLLGRGTGVEKEGDNSGRYLTAAVSLRHKLNLQVLLYPDLRATDPRMPS
ncbi:UV radiation resistance-associated gene protein [Lamellibrachia satsuma]|nr:UV radiation resistance-associated gene protein [Lamellibrachia satsuma]